MQPSFEWGSFSEFLSAIASFAACVVAIWGARIQHWLMRPKLHLTLFDPLGTQRNGRVDDRSVVVRWYHLSVENKQRWNPISDVRVYLLEVEGLRDAFLWTGCLPLNFQSEKRYEAGNHRKVGPVAYVDLLSLRDDGTMQIRTTFGSSHLPKDFRGETHIRLTVQAKGTEADSAPLHIDVDWDGTWPEDHKAMSEHATIKVADMRSAKPELSDPI